jgi:hypothetical protein
MALALVALLRTASLASPQSQYEKLVQKYAVSLEEHAGKTGCICSALRGRHNPCPPSQPTGGLG